MNIDGHPWEFEFEILLLLVVCLPLLYVFGDLEPSQEPFILLYVDVVNYKLGLNAILEL